MKLWHKLGTASALFGSCSYMHGLVGAALETHGVPKLGSWASGTALLLFLVTVIFGFMAAAAYTDKD